MAVATLPGTHLYIQVLGNSDLDGCVRFRHFYIHTCLWEGTDVFT